MMEQQFDIEDLKLTEQEIYRASGHRICVNFDDVIEAYKEREDRIAELEDENKNLREQLYGTFESVEKNAKKYKEMKAEVERLRDHWRLHKMEEIPDLDKMVIFFTKDGYISYSASGCTGGWRYIE